MKKARKWFTLIAVLLVLAAGGFFAFRAAAQAGRITNVTTTALVRQDLVNSISTKGVVESINKRNVNSSLGTEVRTLDAEVGDWVEQGQVLCVLDTEDLELNIAQQRADLDIAQQESLNQLENNERLYSEAVTNLSSGENTQILNAESSVRSAEVDLENARKNYEDAVRDKAEEQTQGVMDAESNLEAAQLALEDKTRDLENNRTLLAEGIVTQDTVTQLEVDVTDAQHKYIDALDNLETAKLNEQRSIDEAENTLKSAETVYNNASASLNAAKTTAGQELENHKSNVESARITANMDTKLIELQKLEKQLADSTVTAPITGTVTAVYAKEGQPANGLLFVIEDTEQLQIETRIKEYDAGRVTEGMAVYIRSDATGDEQYDGTVTKVNPAAEKTAQGDTNTSGDIEFSADVSVDTPNTPLRIGMNTRLTIVIESKPDVFCVPYDAVTIVNDESVIYVLDGQGEAAAARAVPVTTGMETDFYIEIASDALTDGMEVINDAVAITDGMAVRTGTDTQALAEQRPAS